MTKVPSLNYRQVVRALRRDGWVVVRQRGSHIRLQKHTAGHDVYSATEAEPAGCSPEVGYPAAPKKFASKRSPSGVSMLSG